MYETGRGVPQDYRLAALWYHRAANRGDARGQHHLGLLYDKGQGVRRDFVEAHKWLNLATANTRGADHDYYARLRNAVASKLTIDQIDEAQRRARSWRPLAYP
jgi:TPR repeat protein